MKLRRTPGKDYVDRAYPEVTTDTEEDSQMTEAELQSWQQEGLMSMSRQVAEAEGTQGRDKGLAEKEEPHGSNGGY